MIKQHFSNFSIHVRIAFVLGFQSFGFLQFSGNIETGLLFWVYCIVCVLFFF